jgi:hypothetical protein
LPDEQNNQYIRIIWTKVKDGCGNLQGARVRTQVEVPICGKAAIHHEAHQGHEGFCRSVTANSINLVTAMTYHRSSAFGRTGEMA